MRKLVYVGFAFEHHKNTHAGYHQIRNYVNYDYFIDCKSYFVKTNREPKNYIERQFRRICRKCLGMEVFPWHIFKCIIIGLLRNDVTYHFIYGENSYIPFSKYIRDGNKIVCTFHQPFQWFVDNQWINVLKTIDEIIVVGKYELDFFEKVVGKNRVGFIPHGICTDFYYADNHIQKEHLVLTVGNWLRDYDFADNVYQALLREDERLQITVVAPPKVAESLRPHPRLHFLSGIPDEQLRGLYHRCSVLFLPLIRYTANNSLLEASACGCRIVIASDHQENSYIPSQYLKICSMNLNETISTVKDALYSPKNDGLAEFVHEHYSWVHIGKQIEGLLYENK